MSAKDVTWIGIDTPGFQLKPGQSYAENVRGRIKQGHALDSDIIEMLKARQVEIHAAELIKYIEQYCIFRALELYKKYSTDHNCGNIRWRVNQATRAMRLEIYLKRTKYLLQTEFSTYPFSHHQC